MPFLKCHPKTLPKSRILENSADKEGWRQAIFNSRGDKYVGNWKKNEKDGFGLLITKSGNLYDGNWSQGFRHKFGTSASRNDCNVFIKNYRGSWRCGKFYFNGEKHYKDGGYYRGEFKRNRRHGLGMMWYADGSFYHGYWEDDKRQGEGMLVLCNGNRYEGGWEKDKKEGRGKFYHCKTGQVQKGIWFEDICVLSLMDDMPFRQAATDPTKYPIPKVELADFQNVYNTEESIWLDNIFLRDFQTYYSGSVK